PAFTSSANAGDGAKRSPNASCITPATFSATSIPTSSNNVIGPTGKPNCTIRSSSSSIAVPSASRCPASFMYGVRIRFTQNPGLSFTTIAVFPMRRPNATAVVTTPGAVRADGITSSSGMRATGEKKCMPIICSGRRAASAMRPIGMVDVLDANTARSGVHAGLDDGRSRDSGPHEPRAHDAEPPHFGGRGRVGDAEVLLELARREEDLDELAGDVGDGELTEQLCLALQATGEPVGQAVLDRLERGERRRVVSLRLLQHLLARRAKHEAPPERVAVEQPPGEAARTLSLGAPSARHALRRGERDVPEKRGVDELIDDPEPEGLLRPLHLAGEDDVERG